MANRGVAPADMTTDVGKFRALYGDLAYVPLSPDEPGYGDYAQLSDAEIEAFIEQGAGSIAQGIGWLYLAMAGQAAQESKSIKDQDLSIDTTKRAADLRALAQFWFDRDDATQDEYFDIVPMGSEGGFIPEATIPIWGRQYTIGRWR